MYANSYSKTIALLILINFCACAFIEDKLGIGTNNPSQIGQTPSDCQDTTDQGCQTPQTPSSLGTWDQMTDGPVGLLWASAAGVSGKGYVLNGCKDVFCVGNYAHKATLEFDPSMNSGLGSWTTRETFPEQVTTSVTNYIGFGASTGNIGLFGLGVYLVQTPPINISTFHHGDIFELTPYSSSLWTKIDRPSTVHADGQLDRRKNSVSLAIDQDIYLGMGSSASAVLDDWWKYDTISRNWKKLAPLPSVGTYMQGERLLHIFIKRKRLVSFLKKSLIDLKLDRADTHVFTVRGFEEVMARRRPLSSFCLAKQSLRKQKNPK